MTVGFLTFTSTTTTTATTTSTTIDSNTISYTGTGGLCGSSGTGVLSATFYWGEVFKIFP